MSVYMIPIECANCGETNSTYFNGSTTNCGHCNWMLDQYGYGIGEGCVFCMGAGYLDGEEGAIKVPCVWCRKKKVLISGDKPKRIEGKAAEATIQLKKAVHRLNLALGACRKQNVAVDLRLFIASFADGSEQTVYEASLGTFVKVKGQ